MKYRQQVPPSNGGRGGWVSSYRHLTPTGCGWSIPFRQIASITGTRNGRALRGQFVDPLRTNSQALKAYSSNSSSLRPGLPQFFLNAAALGNVRTLCIDVFGGSVNPDTISAGPRRHHEEKELVIEVM